MKFKHSEVQDLLEPQADLYFNALAHEQEEELKHIREALVVVRQLSEDKVKAITGLLGEVHQLGQDEVKLLDMMSEMSDETIIYSTIQTLLNSPLRRMNTTYNCLQKEVDKLSEKNGIAF